MCGVLISILISMAYTARQAEACSWLWGDAAVDPVRLYADLETKRNQGPLVRYGYDIYNNARSFYAPVYHIEGKDKSDLLVTRASNLVYRGSDGKTVEYVLTHYKIVSANGVTIDEVNTHPDNIAYDQKFNFEDQYKNNVGLIRLKKPIPLVDTDLSDYAEDEKIWLKTAAAVFSKLKRHSGYIQRDKN